MRKGWMDFLSWIVIGIPKELDRCSRMPVKVVRLRAVPAGRLKNDPANQW